MARFAMTDQSLDILPDPTADREEIEVEVENVGPIEALDNMAGANGDAKTAEQQLKEQAEITAAF